MASKFLLLCAAMIVVLTSATDIIEDTVNHPQTHADTNLRIREKMKAKCVENFGQEICDERFLTLEERVIRAQKQESENPEMKRPKPQESEQPKKKLHLALVLTQILEMLMGNLVTIAVIVLANNQWYQLNQLYPIPLQMATATWPILTFQSRFSKPAISLTNYYSLF